jgi:shikimate dehydrogenase
MPLVLKNASFHKKPSQDKALILGNGGAAKAVKYVLDKHNIHHKPFPEALKSI